MLLLIVNADGLLSMAHPVGGPKLFEHYSSGAENDSGERVASQPAHKSHLGFYALVALIFYEVSGGAFGTEVGLRHTRGQ